MILSGNLIYINLRSLLQIAFSRVVEAECFTVTMFPVYFIHFHGSAWPPPFSYTRPSRDHKYLNPLVLQHPVPDDFGLSWRLMRGSKERGER
ncbi:hypothetical protein CEXT_258581 [Caerostris extrusa]|uniref:Uncharacterized protein n=1 Tax=Caerostris extrusa TaxID=172846 RepID=A0AAV4M2R1_CAEEX|nr:hypothetical protein CEXT_258581 [Caerostris extrusa]